eukprot:3078021-Amphidinium_carterae.1
MPTVFLSSSKHVSNSDTQRRLLGALMSYDSDDVNDHGHGDGHGVHDVLRLFEFPVRARGGLAV